MRNEQGGLLQDTSLSDENPFCTVPNQVRQRHLHVDMRRHAQPRPKPGKLPPWFPVRPRIQAAYVVQTDAMLLDGIEKAKGGENDDDEIS